MKFAEFQRWRSECLAANPDLVDCAETNLYRSLAYLQALPENFTARQAVHRCDLARLWLSRYGFPADASRHALVCRGVRHALDLVFRHLARRGAQLWIPTDVYPVYGELAAAAGLAPGHYRTLPGPCFPDTPPTSREEYLLIANPWKPLGRHLHDSECASLVTWLSASPRRRALVDCVYDLTAPFHATTQTLQRTGQAILVHSVTKGWLSPRIFGVTLLGESHQELEVQFRASSPTQDHLQKANWFLAADAQCPHRVILALKERAALLLAALPKGIRELLITDPAVSAPGCYFFPVTMLAEQLLRDHRLVGVPASVFGANWDGTILTSLASRFTPGDQSSMGPERAKLELNWHEPA